MPQISAYLSADALAGWKRLSSETGASVTAIIEALGRAANEGHARIPASVVSQARAVDVERRTRKPGR